MLGRAQINQCAQRQIYKKLVRHLTSVDPREKHESNLHSATNITGELKNDRKYSLMNRFVTKVKIYKDLSKFNLSSLVVMTTLGGYLFAGLPLDLSVLVPTCLGTGLCAASANTFNQIIEKDRDSMMSRTNRRPLPSKKISTENAAIWGFTTGATGSVMLLIFANPLTAALGLGNIFFYSIPYTLSKTRTEWNTWIGAAVGAIPPVMGTISCLWYHRYH
jgi:protoheme IX farnesyltransferase